MYNYKSTVQVSECAFVSNPITAVYNEFSKGSFSKCRFDSCSTRGVYNRYSNITYTSCSVSGNRFVSAAGGSAMVNVDSTIVLTNCIFYGNETTEGIGAIDYAAGKTIITNCTFFDNKAGNGRASVAESRSSGSISFANCILWGATDSSVMLINNTYNSIKAVYTIVQGGYAGVGNLNLAPRFIDSSNGNFDLQPCSPAINKGSVDSIPAGVMNDFAGRPRIFNASVDMGAYECTSLPTTFMFTGNGNWNVVDNWQCNWLPPASLPSGSKIFITPVVGGNCILNQPYTISPGAELRVMPGAKLVVPGLKIQ